MAYVKKNSIKTKPAPALNFKPYTLLYTIHNDGTQDYYRVKFTNIKPVNEPPQYFIQVYESRDTAEYKELTTNYYRDGADYQTAVTCLQLAMNDPRYKRIYK